MITKKQEKEYLKHNGVYCVWCKGEDIKIVDNTDFDIGCCRSKIFCRYCKKSYFDVYTLTGVEEADE